MDAFVETTGIVMPLDRHNVDTDAIIPKQFLKSIKRTGFGANLFDEWRYLDHGEPSKDNSQRPLNKNFILNQARYQGATVLLVRSNFGCGSSREHAPWALLDYGFKVIVGSSFADIFYNNCFKNGILPIVLNESQIDDLFKQVIEKEAYSLTVNLERRVITAPGGANIPFEIEKFRQHCLLNGLDDIALTIEHISAIEAYEQRRRKETPWLFAGDKG